MRRRPLDKFCLDNYTPNHSELREQKSKSRRTDHLKIARFHQDQDYQDYLNNKNCPSPCSISSESSSSHSDFFQVPPDQLTKEDMFLIYESLTYQCPLNLCTGSITSENNNFFKCSNPACNLQVHTGSRFMDRDEFISLLKPKFSEHSISRCPEIPCVLFIANKMNIVCYSCNYYDLV